MQTLFELQVMGCAEDKIFGLKGKLKRRHTINEVDTITLSDVHLGAKSYSSWP